MAPVSCTATGTDRSTVKVCTCLGNMSRSRMSSRTALFFFEPPFLPAAAGAAVSTSWPSTASSRSPTCSPPSPELSSAGEPAPKRVIT
jgi:hypothetical protein